ncbi:MAG: hypothetical protein IJW29_02960 [Clostridia bacterium]|nr:hypothetical protein [Clostridia bacterium]
MAKETRAQVEGKYLEYLDKPLVREGNTICYGDMSEPCILVLEIMSQKEVNGKKLPKDIFIQVIDSKDPTKIIKQGKKEGLHDAFSVGLVWLDLALKAAQ